jgi:hypothetical protein
MSVTFECSIQMQRTEHEELIRVCVEGKHVGCVRYFEGQGWSPIGAFVFRAKLEPVYFRTAQQAALALVAGRRKVAVRMGRDEAGIEAGMR